MEPRASSVDDHLHALERDEARHSVILAILARFATGAAPRLRWWPLGAPGECAAQAPGYPIVLGEVTPAQCRALAATTCDLDSAGVVGPGQSAHWYADVPPSLG